MAQCMLVNPVEDVIGQDLAKEVEQEDDVLEALWVVEGSPKGLMRWAQTIKQNQITIKVYNKREKYPPSYSGYNYK